MYLKKAFKINLLLVCVAGIDVLRQEGRGEEGGQVGMGNPSPVHPDSGPGVCAVPSDEGVLARWDQASSPLAG